MRRPRLVYVVTHPATADLLLRGQLAWMAAQGFDVTVIAAPGELHARIAAREGVATRAVPMARDTDPRGDVLALARLARALRSLRPDVVNAGTPKAGFLGMVAARAARVPVRIYLLRGLRLETVEGPLRRVLDATERLASACAHDVVCVSRSLRDAAVGGGHVPARKAIVVGGGSSNGVDAARFAASPALRAAGERLAGALGIGPADPVIGFVGRLVADKGVDEALDALARVRRALPAAKLLVVGGNVGDPDLDPAVVRKLAGAEGVVGTGHVDDVAPYYARMDVLAFPSHREGFPNAVLEAGAAGVPVVGFPVTGTVDAVVDGVTGALVAHRDGAALGDALLGYLRDPERRRAHGEAARARVARDFSREAVWAAWLAFYRQRLAARGLPLPVPR